MIYRRLIPVLLFDDGAVYRSRGFARHFRLGDPVQQLARYMAWDVDEIVYLDMRRREGGRRLIEVLPEITRTCFAPFAAGGGIRTLDDIHEHLDAGADRVVINTEAFDRPGFITEAAERYGSQAIIVSIDARRSPGGGHEVVVGCGGRPTGVAAADWAHEVAERGAGEILVNSIDRDGTGTGYELDLVRAVSSRVTVPVIACGGAGCYDDFTVGISEGGVGSVAAANLFAFRELSYLHAKDVMLAAGLRVRPSLVSAALQAPHPAPAA